MEILRIRKLADKNGGRRETRYHPRTGEPYLTNPDTPGDEHEPWPLAGVRFEGEPPSEACVPMRYIQRAVADGWVRLIAAKVVHEPGGPKSNSWQVTHTFTQAKKIVFQTVNGDVVYRVVSNPGKYDDKNEPSGKRVDWFFHIERERDGRKQED